jgi:regulatory protein
MPFGGFGSQRISLKGRALKHLASREHSRAELRQKLLPHATEGDDVDAVLDGLSAQGHLSDERAAEALTHRRAPKLGTQRLVQELKTKGINTQELGELIQRLRDTEMQRAQAVWVKKFGDLNNSARHDRSSRAKQIRFMAARGFGADVIAKLLRD